MLRSRRHRAPETYLDHLTSTAKLTLELIGPTLDRYGVSSQDRDATCASVYSAINQLS